MRRNYIDNLPGAALRSAPGYVEKRRWRCKHASHDVKLLRLPVGSCDVGGFAILANYLDKVSRRRRPMASAPSHFAKSETHKTPPNEPEAETSAGRVVNDLGLVQKYLVHLFPLPLGEGRVRDWENRQVIFEQVLTVKITLSAG